MTLFDVIRYPINMESPLDGILDIPREIMNAFTNSGMMQTATPNETEEQRLARVKHNVIHLREFLKNWEEPNDNL